MKTDFNKMSKEIQKKTLSYKLNQIEEAFADISSIWCEDNSELTESSLSPFYPFKSSFDELALEVSNWVDDAKERIEKF